MAIVPSHIDPRGLKPGNLDVCLPVFLGFAKASAIAAVYTKQTFASASSGTFDFGTQIDVCRNLIYQISVTDGTQSNPFTAGTLYVMGSDYRGSGITESVNISALGASSGISQGVVKFASLKGTGALSFSGVAMHTASSTNSNSVSFSIGVGNVLGLPNPLGRGTNIIRAVQGTSAFTNWTQVSGPVGTAGISVTPTLGSGSAQYVVLQLNGADFRGGDVVNDPLN